MFFPSDIFRATRRQLFYCRDHEIKTEEAENLVSVSASARGSTWTKLFAFDNVGLEDPNFQAYTYDFTVYNNTGDAVSDFIFTLTFRQEVYLSS